MGYLYIDGDKKCDTNPSCGGYTGKYFNSNPHYAQYNTSLFINTTLGLGTVTVWRADVNGTCTGVEGTNGFLTNVTEISQQFFPNE